MFQPEFLIDLKYLYLNMYLLLAVVDIYQEPRELGKGRAKILNILKMVETRRQDGPDGTRTKPTQPTTHGEGHRGRNQKAPSTNPSNPGAKPPPTPEPRRAEGRQEDRRQPPFRTEG